MALSDNLISYWKLDEVSGNALDAHGTNDLTDNNSVGTATGKINNGRDFEDSSTQWFSHSDNADLSFGDEDFTATAWAKLESKPAAGTILAKGSSNDGEYYFLYRGGGTDRFQFQVFSSLSFGGGHTVNADTLGSPSTGTWYFIVVWHDATANTINIQVNDGTVDSISHSTGVLDHTGVFTLGGGYPHSPTAGELWDGIIDEVGLWRRVLTSGERTDLYNGGSGRDYSYIIGGAAAITRAYAIFI